MTLLPSSIAVLTDSLTKSYRGRVAVDDLNLVVADREVVALTGPNGSGKTTSLKLIACLIEPTFGVSVVNDTTSLGFVSADGPGFAELTVAELLDLHAALHDQPADVERRAALLRAFGLEARAGHRLASLSTGLRRCAAICASIAVDPDLLLLDEATATLDPEAVLALEAALAERALNRRATLLATQDLAFAERVASRVFILDEGTTVAAGVPTSLCTRHNVPNLAGVFSKVTGRTTTAEDVHVALARR